MKKYIETKYDKMRLKTHGDQMKKYVDTRLKKIQRLDEKIYRDQIKKEIQTR